MNCLYFNVKEVARAVVVLLFVSLIPAFGSAPSSEPGSFPIIFYAVPDSDEAFAKVKRWGGTHVHTYGGGLSVENDQSYFDRAARHGLKVMANLSGKVRLEKEMGLGSLEKYIDHFKAHAALGFWYLYDEPSSRHSAQEVQPLYDLLKRKTPDVEVAIALNWTEDYAEFRTIQDIVLNDFYPVTGAPFPYAGLHTLTNFTTDVMKAYDAVVPVLQMMNWQSLAKEGEKELRGYPVEQLRYPNAAEMRYMSFSSIAMGAKGISFYSYIRSMQTDPQWAEETLAPILKEVREFTDKVAGSEIQRVMRAEDDEARLGMWQAQDEYLVVLANCWPAPRRFIRSVRQYLPDGKLIPWGKTRESAASLENGMLIVEVEPWEILIWRLQPEEGAVRRP